MFTFTVPLAVQSLVLLLVRVMLSVAFFRESRIKFKDMKGFAKADSVPLPVAYAVAVAEACAALSMLTGVLAQWAGAGLVLLMCVTSSMHVFKWHTPYKNGWEYDLLMLTLAAIIAAFGAGQFALGNLF